MSERDSEKNSASTPVHGARSVEVVPERDAEGRPVKKEEYPRHQVIYPGYAPKVLSACLVTIHSREPASVGKRFQLDRSLTRIGRGSDNHIILDDDSVSRCHALLEQRGARWLVLDIGSSNGTYVNGMRVDREVFLSNHDRVIFGPTIFRFLSGTNVDSQYYEEMMRLSTRDGLTDTRNKRYFLEALDLEIGNCRRLQRELTIVLFQVDHLARINEEHGYLTEDFVFMEVAPLALARLAAGEVCARLEGGSFAFLLPDRSLSFAEALAAAFQHQVSRHNFLFQGRRIDVSIQISVTLLQESDADAAALLKRAEEQRNQVGA